RLGRAALHRAHADGRVSRALCGEGYYAAGSCRVGEAEPGAPSPRPLPRAGEGNAGLRGVRRLLLIETVAEDLVYTLDHEQVRRHRWQRGQREPRSGNRAARDLMYRARAVEAVQAPRAGVRGVE